MKEKKVMVSGCYDLLYSGHSAFFKAAAEFDKDLEKRFDNIIDRFENNAKNRSGEL